MATLEKIRSKGVLLVVVVGLALLSFIVGDFLKEGSTYFNKSKENVAKIVGEDINIKEYSVAIDQLTEVYKIETGKTELNEEMMTQLRQSVWETMLNEKILNAEAKKLGLVVGVEELSDRLIGNNIHPLIMQRRAFAGENGQFSRQALMQFQSTLEQPATDQEQKQQIEKLKSYWKFWENTVKNNILQEKYNALISKSVTANALDAKMSFQTKKSSFDVAYVIQPYYLIPDSTVKVTDTEIAERYSKQKEQYKQEANCEIKYVAFDKKPLAEDYKEVAALIAKVTPEFKTTNDIVGVVNSNSDVMYNAHNYSEKTVPAELKDFAFKGNTGDVYGPSFVNDTYTMARIVQSGIMQSDSVKLRHIYLVSKDESKTDSIISAIKAGADFGALAMKYSAVKQTASKGGEIGWLQEGTQGVEKEITTQAFSKSKNEVFTVKNAQGTQIMQVLDKTAPRRKVKLAILIRKVEPSNKSISKIYNDAKQFAVDLKAVNFEKKAKESNYMVRTATDVLQTTEKITDIPQTRQIVRWAFKSSKGDVSDVFECGSKFIVALSSEVNKKGYRSLDKVKDQLKAEIIKDKKAELMIKNLASQLLKTPTLEGIAGFVKDSIKTANSVNFASYQFGTAGFEPSVLGKVSVLAVGKVSNPIKGNAGVFVVRTGNKKENSQVFDAKMEIMQLNGRTSYSLPYMIIQDLKDKADITDNRLNFF